MDAGACLCPPPPPRSALYLPSLPSSVGLACEGGRGVSPSDLAEASIISGLGPLCLDREGLFEKTLICDYLTIC